LLFRNADNVYQSERLLEYPWLIHGFGTRLSEDWPGPYTGAKQVHSDRIFNADAAPNGRIGEGDALVASTPGRTIGIRTADCVPILLVDPRKRAVAAVHAGWRGTVQNIAAKTVERLRREYGTEPSDVLAVIGPAIGECCYEVGSEVAEQFEQLLPDRRQARHLSLEEANRRQLVGSGLRDEAIETGGLCTRCGSEFHSWRRDKEASGRMVAAIGIRDER
jgi:YfiH family protein